MGQPSDLGCLIWRLRVREGFEVDTPPGLVRFVVQAIDPSRRAIYYSIEAPDRSAIMNELLTVGESILYCGVHVEFMKMSGGAQVAIRAPRSWEIRYTPDRQ